MEGQRPERLAVSFAGDSVSGGIYGISPDRRFRLFFRGGIQFGISDAFRDRRLQLCLCAA